VLDQLTVLVINIFPVTNRSKESGISLNKHKEYAVSASDSKREWQGMVFEFLNLESRVSPILFEDVFLLLIQALDARRNY